MEYNWNSLQGSTNNTPYKGVEVLYVVPIFPSTILEVAVQMAVFRNSLTKSSLHVLRGTDGGGAGLYQKMGLGLVYKWTGGGGGGGHVGGAHKYSCKLREHDEYNLIIIIS